MAQDGASINTARRIALRDGAYAPILTMFSGPSEELDLDVQGKHAVRLAKGGLVGLVAMGSNGEQVHLSTAERSAVISAMRSALDEAGFQDIPLIAGCSEQSTRHTIERCREAAAAGASYAIILPPSYFRANMNSEVIYQYFVDVAGQSPIPIIMYNFPGAVAGIDMDSDLMIRIAEHANVHGCKLTCGNTGKLTRIAAATGAMSTKGPGKGFLATGGFADMAVQVAVSGGSGIIAGTGNIVPKLCARVWRLWSEGKQDEAIEVQKLLAEADWELCKGGVSSTKAALQHFYGYGGVPRKPLPAYSAAQTAALASALAAAVKVEDSL